MEKNTQPQVVNISNNIQSQDAIGLAQSEPVKQYNNIPPKSFKRNNWGLLEEMDYVFNENGNVNWRAMVPVEHLYINTQNIERIEKKYGKKITELSIVDDKIEDVDLVIKLIGLKKIAAIRGYTSVDYSLYNVSENYAAAVCNISWIPNFETPEFLDSDGRSMNRDVYFSGGASATPATTNAMTRNYLVEMAENRAFCRAVRSCLLINIVSQEELVPKAFQNQSSQEDSSPTINNPVSMLTATLEAKNISFDKLKARLIKLTENPEEQAKIKAYNSPSDIPTKEIFGILGRIKAKEDAAAAKVDQPSQ